MKKKLGRLSLESFDQAPTGNVVAPLAQPETPPQPLVPTAGYSETPFSGQENYAAESNQEHEVASLWKTLLGYYKSRHDDDLVETLNAGASLTEINTLETKFHTKLPAGYVALLELADGQDLSQGHDAGHEIFGHRLFNSIERVVKQSEEFQSWDKRAWDMYHERDTGQGAQDVDFSSKWLVFGGSQDDDIRPSILVLDFAPTHEGTMGQVVSIDFRGNRRVVVAPDFMTWFKRFVAHLTSSHAALESHDKPAYPLRKALEDSAMVVDDDELDQLAIGANSLSSCLDSTSMSSLAMESDKKNPSDIAKSRMHLRFKKLKDGFVDTFRSAAGMISKYSKQLDELETELLKGHTHGQIKVNMSHLWQHFSDEKGPITHNLLGKVREDVAFSTYILTDFSHHAYEQLEGLQRALHTGQGDSDQQALRTAQDVEKLKGPAEYMDQKWICAAGEQPYLSVTGLSAQTGRHPRSIAIEGTSLERLAQLATPYRLREYGSFFHGMKKLFKSNSNEYTHLAAEDLAKLIVMGREYLESARLYLAIYNKVWPIFRRLDDSLDMIWDDFGLEEYSIHVEGEAEDGSDDTHIEWSTSSTGNLKRRLVVFDQLMAVVQNFADSVIQPGVNELARALRAAKFHGYLVAAGIKAAEGHGQNAGNVSQEGASFQGVFGDIFPKLNKQNSQQEGGPLNAGTFRRVEQDKLAFESMAMEFFFGKKPQQPAQYQKPEWKNIPMPKWDPHHPPSIQESVKVLREAMQQHDPEGLKTFHRPATAQELQKLAALVKEHTGKDLPHDYVELYKISNGGISQYKHLRIFDHDEFIPIHEVIYDYEERIAFNKDDWQGQKSKCFKGVQGEQWWEPWWVPFSSSGSGDGYCVDVNPGPGGAVGQVVDWGHDFNDRSVRAPSLAAFIALSIHRQLYLLNHKKDWEAKNGTAPKGEDDEDE